MILICAYCGGRGKGITLTKDREFYICTDMKACEKRKDNLDSRDKAWLATERLNILRESNIEPNY